MASLGTILNTRLRVSNLCFPHVELFNPRSFIFFDLDIPQQALNQIRFYEQNPSEYERMLNEPILANGLETIQKYFSWDESIGDGLLKTRIRSMMGL